MHEHQISRTAFNIAKAMVFMARDPKMGHLVPPETDEVCRLFLQAGGVSMAQIMRWVQNPLLRRVAYVVESIFVRGLLAHFVVRKLHIEALTRQCIEEKGVRQVVYIAGGFDTLTLRLGKAYPEITFIEVDHPPTSRLKTKVLQENNRLPKNLHLIAADLAVTPIRETLNTCPAYDSNQSTLFIAEGLLMYLPMTAIDELFAALRQGSGAQSYFLFTCMNIVADGRIQFDESSRWMHWWLDRVHEPLRWGIHTPEVEAFLSQRHYRLLELIEAEALRERYLTPLGLQRRTLAHGERICLAAINALEEV